MHPYADLVIRLILPTLVLGIFLIIVGVRRERRREREGSDPGFASLVIDFGDPKYRRTPLILLAGILCLSLLYAFAGYKAYEFTESETFCGTMCHKVMGTEHRSHDYSPGMHGQRHLHVREVRGATREVDNGRSGPQRPFILGLRG